MRVAENIQGNIICGLKEFGADITNDLLSIEQQRYDREFVKIEKQRTDELNKLTINEIKNDFDRALKIIYR